MTFLSPDLAARPFQNLRPVRRLSVVMWVLGGIILVFNIWLYGTHVASLGDDLDRLEELETRLAVADEEVLGLEGEVEGLQLTWQNRQAEFLNRLIDQRTFSWSALIDHLSEALPIKVRLSRLTPRVAGKGSARERRSSAGEGPERVMLGMAGSAADDAAMLEFLDQLFEHPNFDTPRLSAASRGDGGEVSSFTLAVAYLPQAVTADETVAGEEATPTDEVAAATQDQDSGSSGGDAEAAGLVEAAGLASPVPVDGAEEVSE